MSKFSSPGGFRVQGWGNVFTDDTGNEATMHENIELKPHMSRQFDEATVRHIRDVVLPAAIEQKNVKVVRASEDVLKSWGMAIPNHVSGRWVASDVPRNETMLREMYAHRMPEYGYQIIRSRVQFPDWLLLDSNNEFINAEVEHRSIHFRDHGHDPTLCDLIVCWEHNYPETPLPVLELFSGKVYEPNAPIQKRGDRSKLWVNTIEPRGLERSRQSAKVQARHDLVVEVYRENVAKYGKRSAAQKTAERLGYSRGHIYCVVRQLDK